MFQVVVLGDPNSGKTTFLGLLYATQVRSGSDTEDRFRFHVGLESLPEITFIFEQLMSRNFPEAATKKGITEVSFDIGLSRAHSSFFRREEEWKSSASSTIRFRLLRTQEEGESRETGSWSMDEKARAFLENDAVVILVDSAKLAGSGGDPQVSPMSRYDTKVDRLLNPVQRVQESGKTGLLHPIFMFSKFDRVNPEVLRAAKLAPEPPRVDKTGRRAAYAEALLKLNMPQTLTTVKSREGGGVKLGKPAYFFSWVRTEELVPGQQGKIRLRRGDLTGWEPDYSNEEYLAFLEHLAEIAHRSEH